MMRDTFPNFGIVSNFLFPTEGNFGASRIRSILKTEDFGESLVYAVVKSM